MDIYFASSIENLNNIFSLQFLLPVYNYKSIYNYKESKFDVDIKYITFYNTIPKIGEDEFIIKFKIKDSRNFIQVNKNTILYPKNFSINRGVLIFLNEKAKKIASARTILTAEVKNMKNYINNSYVLGDDYRFDKIDNNIVVHSYDNNLLESESLNINLYDRILGAIYYSLFKNKSSIVSNKKIREEYHKMLLLEKYIENLKENKFYIGNIKKGFEKERDLIKSNIRKELISGGNRFLKVAKDNEYSINTNNVFNCSGNDLMLINIIINNIYKNNDIKTAMIKIGEDIKLTIAEKEYISGYRVLYNIIINGVEKYSVENIKVDMLKSFLVALVKYEKISEIDELSTKYEIKDSIYGYFFAGMIQRYSNISKIIVDEVEKDIICKMIIDNEISNINKYIEFARPKHLYQKIQKFQLESNMYKLRVSNMKKELENFQIKSLTRKIISFKFKINSENYIVSFNENENKDFIRHLKMIGVKPKRNSRYKSFTIKKLGINKLNDIDEKNILNFINSEFS